MVMVRKLFGKRLLKDLTIERKKVEEFEESFMWRLWMNQSCITLGFLKILFKSSLSFVVIRGIYTGVRMECEESGFSKQGWLATWLSREIQPWDNWTASCPILSYSAPASMTLQLLACLARVLLLAFCSRESPTRSSRETLFSCTLLSIQHFISLTTLITNPPKYRVTNCWNSSKFGTE